MTPKRIQRAAFFLRDRARVLKDSNIDRHGKWVAPYDGYPGGADALKVEHDELLSLSRELLAHAIALKTAQAEGL